MCNVGDSILKPEFYSLLRPLLQTARMGEMGVSFLASTTTNMKAFLLPFIAFLLFPELAVGITRHYKFDVCAFLFFWLRVREGG